MSSSVLANVSVVAIDGRAILIEGEPGSGKTSLALSLIDRGAVLIGDDGVTLERQGATVIASPPPNTAGKIEIRNVGVVEIATTEAPISLVLLLNPAASRYPLDRVTRNLAGVPIPALEFFPGDPTQAIRAEYALLMHGLHFPPPLRTA